MMREAEEGLYLMLLVDPPRLEYEDSPDIYLISASPPPSLHSAEQCNDQIMQC